MLSIFKKYLKDHTAQTNEKTLYNERSVFLLNEMSADCMLDKYLITNPVSKINFLIVNYTDIQSLLMNMAIKQNVNTKTNVNLYHYFKDINLDINTTMVNISKYMSNNKVSSYVVDDIEEIYNIYREIKQLEES